LSYSVKSREPSIILASSETCLPNLRFQRIRLRREQSLGAEWLITEKTMRLEGQVISGIKWSAAAKLLTQSITWAVTLVVLRLLQPGDYGLMALCTVVLSIVGGVAELGLGAALVQSPQLTRSQIARIAGALCWFNGAAAAATYVGAPVIAAAFKQPGLENLIRLLSAQFLLAALAAVPEALAQRELKFRWLAGIELVSGVTTSAATLALALSGAGVWSLAVGALVGNALRTTILAFGGTFVFPALDLRGIGALLRFGGAWSGARFAWQLTYQADVLIAGRFLSQEAVGLYAVAVNLANMPLQKAMGIINPVAFPALSKLQEDLPQMRRRLLHAIRLLGFGTIPLLWGLSAVTPEFVHIVLGPDWADVTLPLQVIAVVAPLRMVATLFATALSALGRPEVELMNTLVGLAVFGGAFLIGVQWGVPGLSFAYLTGVCLSFAATFPRISRVVQIPLAQVGAACRSSIFAGVVMLLVVYGVRLALEDLAEVWRFPVLIIAGALTYMSVLSVLDPAIWREAFKAVGARA
jgi:teichuronic acid exporter